MTFYPYRRWGGGAFSDTGRGFTLVELLVVIGVIAMLIAMLLLRWRRAEASPEDTVSGECARPASGGASVCDGASGGAGLRIGGGDYASGIIVVGADQLAGAVSDLAGGEPGRRTGLGRLIELRLLNGKQVFCPTDGDANPAGELEKLWGRSRDNAWGSYLFRQLDGQAGKVNRTRLGSLGMNKKGAKITALAMDVQCTLRYQAVPIKRPHDGVGSTIGYMDGSAKYVPNVGENLTLKGDVNSVDRRLDGILEYADSVGPSGDTVVAITSNHAHVIWIGRHGGHVGRLCTGRYAQTAASTVGRRMSSSS